MLQIHEIMNELDGNGIEQVEILDITKELTQLSIIKERLVGRLSNLYSEEEVNDMVSIVSVPNMHQVTVERFLSSLSNRERQCYFKYKFEEMSFAAIARELGVSKSMVQQSIERARKKLKIVKAN